MLLAKRFEHILHDLGMAGLEQSFLLRCFGKSGKLLLLIGVE